MENGSTDTPGTKQTKEPSQLFTYYQGDINAVVDEHFSRALNKANIPKDLSNKTKSSLKSYRSDMHAHTYSSVAYPSPSWSKATYSPSSSALTQFSEDPHPSQGVIMGPQGLSSGLWAYPTRQGASFDVPSLVYPQPSAEGSSSSFLNLLYMDRPTSGVVVSPLSKSDSGSEWNNTADFRDPPGSRINRHDSGVQVPERSKDLYWY